MKDHQFTTTLAYISDPGHGWLAVPLQDVAAMGIQDKISSYSFISRAEGVAYLEEDCDASLYINRLIKMGISPDLPEEYTGYFSRSRPSFGDDQFDAAFWKDALEGAFNK